MGEQSNSIISQERQLELEKRYDRDGSESLTSGELQIIANLNRARIRDSVRRLRIGRANGTFDRHPFPSYTVDG